MKLDPPFRSADFAEPLGSVFQPQLGEARRATSSDRLLREQDVAEMMAVSVKTLQMWRWQGKGPSFGKLGRRVAYKLDAVKSYIDANVFRSTTEADQKAGG
jgi:predicted DNA-binding transcriptional regulator AlpA